MGGAFTGDTAYNTLYQNPGHGNNWLKLKLEGRKTNKAAIGARIKVTVRTPSGSRDIYKTVSSGASFGNLPRRQELGLGKAQSIQSVEILWPITGQRQVVAGLQPNQCYKIVEGQSKASVVQLKSFKFNLMGAAPQDGAHQHHHHHMG
jgi:hypothetical protein